MLIQLLNSSRWPEMAAAKIVVGRNGEPKGFTNETAIETRVVDMEDGGEGAQSPKAESEGVITIQGTPKKEDAILVETETRLEEEQNDVEKLLNQEVERKLAEEFEHRFDDDEVVDSDQDDEESGEEESEEEQKVSRNKKNKNKGKKKEANEKAKYKQHMFFAPKAKGRKEIYKEINAISQDLRPIGIVKAILKSPNRDKEHMVTLTVLEKERLDDDSFLKMLDAHNQSKGDKKKEQSIITNKIAQNSGIFAAPVSKKLPWMTISNIP